MTDDPENYAEELARITNADPETVQRELDAIAEMADAPNADKDLGDLDFDTGSDGKAMTTREVAEQADWDEEMVQEMFDAYDILHIDNDEDDH